MGVIDIKGLAEFLNDAELNRKEVFRLTLENTELTMEQGYDIQQELVNIKLQNGNKIIGYKMDLTSEAEMNQMKIESPIYGHLFDYMLVDDRGKLSMKELIHPKVKSEIAFIMGKDLEGPNMDDKDVLDAMEYVLPAMEIVDSRYENFNFKLPDVVADNSSSSRIIMGSKFTNPQGLEMDQLGVTLSINNEICDFGTGAVVLGHPIKAVVMLVKMLAERGQRVEAGSIIITGGITKALPIKVGDIVSTRIEELGEVSFKVVE